MNDTYYWQQMIHSANFFTTLVKLSALSVDLKPVDIIGYVKLQFNFVGSDKLFEETFYIPENTSKLINLGSEFVKTNEINLLLDKQSFQLPGGSLSLSKMVVNLTSLRKSKRFHSFLPDNVKSKASRLYLD